MLARFLIAEISMAPTLLPGDRLVAARAGLRPGDLAVFEHPTRPGFFLCKRVGAIRGAMMEAMSDFDRPGVIDSRSFGPVALAGAYRVVLRYWPPKRITLSFMRTAPTWPGPSGTPEW